MPPKQIAFVLAEMFGQAAVPKALSIAARYRSKGEMSQSNLYVSAAIMLCYKP